MAWEVISWKGTHAGFYPFNRPCAVGGHVPALPPGLGQRKGCDARQKISQRKRRQDQRAHPMDKSPLALFWRQSGWLPPQRARAGAGTSTST